MWISNQIKYFFAAIKKYKLYQEINDAYTDQRGLSKKERELELVTQALSRHFGKEFAENETKSFKDAVKEYGTEGKDKDVIKNAARTEYEFVSKEIAPKAETTNDLPQGTEGPLTNVELPDLPKTGRR